MKAYRTKTSKLSGTSFREVYKNAFAHYSEIKKRSKRRPYVRSVYFKKDKIFLPLYWSHLHGKKNFRDKIRRMKYFPCGLELIQQTRIHPVSKENPNNSSEILHRFAGVTKNDDLFFVQIKEDKRTGEKWLISTFPLGDK